MMVERACRKCRIITDKKECPICGETSLSTEFTGIVIILDAENSEIAKTMGVKKPGKYALRVR